MKCLCLQPLKLYTLFIFWRSRCNSPRLHFRLLPSLSSFTARGAYVRMTSLTLCISMCHSASKACIRIFVTIPVSVPFAPGSSLLATRGLAGPQCMHPLPGSSSYFTFLIKILISSTVSNTYGIRYHL